MLLLGLKLASYGYLLLNESEVNIMESFDEFRKQFNGDFWSSSKALREKIVVNGFFIFKKT